MSLKIAIVVGSLRAGSFNRTLAKALTMLPSARGHDFSFPEIGDLPLYNQDPDTAPPDAALRPKRSSSGRTTCWTTAGHGRASPPISWRSGLAPSSPTPKATTEKRPGLLQICRIADFCAAQH